MKINRNILNFAKQVAFKSDVRRGKVAAVLFTDSGHIIASASNTRIFGRKNKWTLHAEENLISKCIRLKAIQRFGPLNVLVIRISATGDFQIAKPCDRCSEILKRARVRVFYSDGKGRIEEHLNG